MDRSLFTFARQHATVGLLIAGLLFPGMVQAAGGDRDTGPRLLQAQLPPGLSIRQADCERLVRAVRLATLAHHQEAVTILSAALAAGTDNSGRTSKHECACVVRLFRAAVNAAPDHASPLLETAAAICPECADSLTEALQRLGDKNVVLDPKDGIGPDGQNGPRGARNTGVGGSPGDPGNPGAPGDPGTPSYSAGTGSTDSTGTTGTTGSTGSTGSADNSGDPGDPNDPTSSMYHGLSQRDYQGLDLANPGTGNTTGNVSGDPSVSGFGVGAGPGFPGSPGFSSSVPSSGFTLPRPTAPAVTSAVNS